MTHAVAPRDGRNGNGGMSQYVIIVLSLLPTPLLLFASSSIDAYLRNQTLLHHQYEVLAPFAKISLATLLVGILLSGLSRWPRYGAIFRFFLGAYYLTGLLFLVFAFGRGLQDKLPGVSALSWMYGTIAGLAFWPVLLVVATAVLGKRVTPPVVRAFAVFGAALLAYEGGRLLYSVSTQQSPAAATIANRSDTSDGNSSLPNIYHLVFDAYQTDLFEHSLSDEARKALGGFVYFPNNKALWAQTPMSLASVFSGRQYSYDRTRANYIDEAFNSRSSILYWLRSQTYQNVAYATRNWSRRDAYFDWMSFHGDAAIDDLRALNTEAFWNLWAYSNTPAPLRNTVVRTAFFAQLNDKDMTLLDEGRLLPASAPVRSYLSFEKMMAQEGRLSATGRYTMVHVLVPHAPHRLSADCNYTLGSTPTGPMEQTHCALKMIREFITLLKDLGRFNDSLILIHGDHGGPYRSTNDTSTVRVTEGRSRSLNTVLLVKPIGSQGGGELEALDSKMTLLDISNIILSSVAGRAPGQTGPAPWDPQRVVVPLVEGEMIDSAVPILKRQGFELAEVKQIYSFDHPEGTVISQAPPAYERHLEKTQVAVVVSLGHVDGSDVLPDFLGRDVSEVSAWLREKQLPESAIRHVEHALAPRGIVVGQTPPAGSRADGSEEIVFYVGKGN